MPPVLLCGLSACMDLLLSVSSLLDLSVVSVYLLPFLSGTAGVVLCF